LRTLGGLGRMISEQSTRYSSPGGVAKLVGTNWTVRYTRPNRYVKNGIAYHVVDYARSTQKHILTIMDVGCSNGVAAKTLKKNLSKQGITSHVLGVDLNKRVEKKAKRNLDEFVLADIVDLDPRGFAPADVVICSYAAIWVPVGIRHRILQSCVQFMKEDGVLLTNAGRFERVKSPPLSHTIRYWLQTLWYLTRGWKSFRSELDMRLAEQRKRGSSATRGRAQALKFVESVPASWERLSPRSKYMWHWNIFLRALDVHFWRLLTFLYNKMRRITRNSTN